MAKSNFIVRGGADFSGITRELNKTQGQLKGFSANVNKVFKGMGINIGSFTKFALIGMATRELYKFGKASIEVASDLREVQNVVDVTFGSMSNQISEFSSDAIKQFGLSELSAKKFTSTMGAMLKSSGLTGQTVTDMSIDLAKLSADMASFYNLENEEAFSKIMSGMSGMTQPLKELGINMNIANLENFAMAQGIKKSWQEMNQAEQTMVRYNYLLNVTADSQGDFAREAGTWANQVKILKEQWKEFMGLIGTALIEILLPIVKGLNKLLEILIDVTKEIGKIYTIITGKKVAVEANNNIANTAIDAADGEEELADGIGKAAAAAKKAIAPFDELNVLQSNLGGGAFSELGGLDFGSTANTSMTTTRVDEGLKFKIDDEEPKRFFVWFENKMRWLKETLLIPIFVPAPVFAELRNPIWQPNYGLEGLPTLVPAPEFQPLPNPIWQPNWNIAESLQTATDIGLQKFNAFKSNFSFGMSELVTSVSTSANTLKENIVTSTQGMFVSTSTILASMKTNAIENMKSMKETLVINAQEMQTQVSSAVGGMATSAASSIYQMANSGIDNLNSMFSSSYANLSNWINNTTTALANWGNGMIETISDTAYGMVDSLVSGLKTMWDKLKEYAKATGEKISGSFSGSFSSSGPKFINPIGVAVGALSLMKGVLSMPRIAAGAYAKGGIIDKPTLAMMGEGGRKEIVMPMESNTGWIGELATMITNSMPAQGNSNSGDTTIIVKLGEDTIFEKVISGINRQSRISGKTVITV